MQLAAAFEQIEQAHLAVRAVEDVVLLDLDHRLPAALRGERVARLHVRLLLGEQGVVGDLPFLARDDLG